MGVGLTHPNINRQKEKEKLAVKKPKRLKLTILKLMYNNSIITFINNICHSSISIYMLRSFHSISLIYRFRE